MDDLMFRGDDGNALRFYFTALKNNFQSEKQGRPCFDKALMVDVMTPGTNGSSPTFEVEREYCPEAGIEPTRSEKYDQYQKQVEAFKRGSSEDAMNGVPLSQWPQVDVSQVATLRAQNVFTVEQLAAVADGNLDKIGMGARVLRDQAIAYMQTRQFGVPTAQMAAQMAHLEEDNARLRNEVAALAARMGPTDAAPPVAAPVPDLTFTPPAAAAPDLTFAAPPTPPALI